MHTKTRTGEAILKVLALSVLLGTLFVFGCGANYGGTTSTPTYYTVGGSVSGLAGSGLVLQDNNGNNLNVTANGSFAFTVSLASGTAYSATVLTQPTNPSQTCVPTSNTGTVPSGNVTSVVVT
jgi:hypothetical protein